MKIAFRIPSLSPYVLWLMAFGFLSPTLPLYAHGVETTGSHQSSPHKPPTDPLRFLFPHANANATMRLDSRAGYRYITADALPDHATGQFPGRGNPHSIKRQKLSYRVTLHPEMTGRIIDLGHRPFGVALNGVPFDPLTAEYWNNDRQSGWNIEALSGQVDLGLDRNNAHVQPDGTYHYHGLPLGLLEQFPYRTAPTLLGYAADGYPIYGPWGYQDGQNVNGAMVELKPSYRVKAGHRPDGPRGAYDGLYVQDYEYVDGQGALDACNGRNGVTREYPNGTYYYVISTQYPFIPRCFVGMPDRSFDKKKSQNDGPPTQRSKQPRGGPPDLKQAAKALGISPTALRRALGPPPPNFDHAAQKLGISRDTLIKALHPNGPPPRR